MRRLSQAVVLAVALSAGMVAVNGVARAQNFGTPVAEQYFRVESESAETKSGRPILRGYVYNLTPYSAANVRLGVQAIDAGGQPLGAQTLGWVNGEISANSRRYFEVPVAQPAAGYRVAVQSYELRIIDNVR